MALTLAEVIQAARDRHPAFHKSRVPHAVVARYLTGYQRRLISKASDVNAEAFAQQASVAFALSSENAVGVVGAGTSGGLPATLEGGAPVEVELPVGSALELDFENAQVLVGQFVVGGATATTLQKTAAGWTVNAYAGKYVWISDGPGIDQRRLIVSNTSDTLTISQAWATIPTVGVSIAEVVEVATEVTEEMGAITAIPAEADRIGYLVRLDSAGVPYLDLTKPLLARFAVGIDLPPMEYPLGGSVRFSSGDDTDLELRRYGQRWTLGVTGYGAYILAGKLFLLGDLEDWRDVVSIDLRFVPISPALTRLTDLFLLPDTAYDALVARSAEIMARRVNGLPDVPKVDVRGFVEEALEAEGVFLSGMGRVARTYPQYTRSVW